MAKDLFGRPVVAAADLDTMTPQQVEEAWKASIVTDPHALPEEYVRTLQHRAAARLERREAPAAL